MEVWPSPREGSQTLDSRFFNTFTKTLNQVYYLNYLTSYTSCCYIILCVATVTLGRAALPVLWEFLRMYPTPERARAGDQREMAVLLTPLGLHTKRAGIIARMSGDQLGRG